MPNPVRAGTTQSPCFTVFTLEPTACTSKTASLPGTAAGCDVPSAVEKVGLLG